MVNRLISDEPLTQAQSTDSEPSKSNELLQASIDYSINKHAMSSYQPALLAIEYPRESLHNTTEEKEKHKIKPSTCDCLQRIESKHLQAVTVALNIYRNE